MTWCSLLSDASFNNGPDANVYTFMKSKSKKDDLYILCIFAKTFCRRYYLKTYLDLWKIWLRTRITFMSKNIKFRWVAFFHLHFWQLFFLVFHLILDVKSSIFHQLSNAIKIISTRGQAKKLWAKLQSLPTILKCTLILNGLTYQVYHAGLMGGRYRPPAKINLPHKVAFSALAHVKEQ